ncbi:uncharacterized protein LOC106162714 [Lingula anatina]|uniref:Uncharacterized protein LOC106162714 n=1 Tax=Lingula anatina TaxID=7574 RepID=A0A1S3ICH1_LINAN|nr:uncharacterized protein LOC106162714 [Lingula anatina]XP_023931363.1 uncharacterized protein LOC106162714 [Lingula anatina]|eukprot:XP_013395557.1 uncharacterized protein LOC106162714 [Lingula anatina]
MMATVSPDSTLLGDLIEASSTSDDKENQHSTKPSSLLSTVPWDRHGDAVFKAVSNTRVLKRENPSDPFFLNVSPTKQVPTGENGEPLCGQPVPFFGGTATQFTNTNTSKETQGATPKVSRKKHGFPHSSFLSPDLTKSMFFRKHRNSNKKTPRTLSRLQKLHRDNERNRHHGLNSAIQQLAAMTPQLTESLDRETKVSRMKRVVNYICYLETHIRSLCVDLDIALDFDSLFLTPHLDNIDQNHSPMYIPMKEEYSVSATNSQEDFQESDASQLVTLQSDRDRHSKVSSPTIDSTTHGEEECPQTVPHLSITAPLQLVPDWQESGYEDIYREQQVSKFSLSCDPGQEEKVDKLIKQQMTNRAELVAEDIMLPAVQDVSDDSDDSIPYYSGIALFHNYSKTAGKSHNSEENSPNASTSDLTQTSSMYEESELKDQDSSFFDLLSTPKLCSKSPLTSPERIQSPIRTPKTKREAECHGKSSAKTPVQRGHQLTPTKNSGVIVTPSTPEQSLFQKKPASVQKKVNRLVAQKKQIAHSCLKNSFLFGLKTPPKKACPLKKTCLHMAKRSPVIRPLTMRKVMGKYKTRMYRLQQNMEKGETCNEDFSNSVLKSHQFSSEKEDETERKTSGSESAEKDIEVEESASDRQSAVQEPVRIDLRKTSWMNGFMMFSRINRKNFIDKHPGTHTSHISKLMGSAWRSMTAEEQKPYKDKAKDYSQYLLNAYKLPASFNKDSCSGGEVKEYLGENSNDPKNEDHGIKQESGCQDP